MTTYTDRDAAQPADMEALLRYLLGQYDRVVGLHAQVVLDSAEERKLHALAVGTALRAAEPVRAALDRASSSKDSL